MKKTAFLTICLCLMLISYSGKAQIKIGVKEGLNVSSFILDVQTPENFNRLEGMSLASFHLGGFLRYNFDESISFQAELLYSGQGARFEVEEIVFTNFGTLVVPYEIRRKLNYLSIPLLINYQLDNGLYFEGGFSFDFLLSGKETYEFEEDFGFGIQPQDVNDLHNGADTKLALGMGYELPSGIGFNMRYSFGLGNNLNEDNEFYSEGDEAVNSLFQLGVSFPLYGN